MFVRDVGVNEKLISPTICVLPFAGDVRLTNSALLSNAALNLIAQETTLNGSTLYSGDESISMHVNAMDAQNTYMEAAQTLTINALQNINVTKQEPSIKADMMQEDEIRGKDTLIEIARRFLSE